jgi:hypothetical protein
MVAVISRFLGRGEPLEEPPSDVIHLIVTGNARNDDRSRNVKKNVMASQIWGYRCTRVRPCQSSVVMRCVSGECLFSVFPSELEVGFQPNSLVL